MDPKSDVFYMQNAFVAFCTMAASNHDLKHSGTFLLKIACELGFAAIIVSWIFAPGGRLKHEA